MSGAAAGDRRLLLVHAHPDDETITTGATMARYAAAGARVVLVTCTRGEQGEVIPRELAYLEHDRDAALSPHRVDELAWALSELGAVEQHFLDQLPGAGDGVRYRDSGMLGTPQNERADCFWRADLDAAAAPLARLVRELRPQVAVTYDPDGGYGHPDHVQAHRVLARALEAAGHGERGWTVPKVYWIAVPRSVALAARSSVAAPGSSPFAPVPDGTPLPSAVVDDAAVSTAVDGAAFLAAKTAALRAHATQVAVEGGFFALSNGIGQPISALEHYRLVHGEPAGPFDGAGRETDLFAGLAPSAPEA